MSPKALVVLSVAKILLNNLRVVVDHSMCQEDSGDITPYAKLTLDPTANL
jgi:hypothetical protein